MLTFDNMEELKQVFKEQEEQERDQKASAEKLKALKIREQELKNAKLEQQLDNNNARAHKQPRDPEPKKQSDFFNILALIMSVFAALLPFIVLLVLLLKH